MSDQDFRLDGKTALVTGAARGIGLAIAKRLAEAGATVILADRDAGEGDDSAHALRSLGLSARFITMDVTRRASVEALACLLEREGVILDVLVNNAGIVRNAAASEMSIEDWQEVIDIDLTGVFHCAQVFGRRMVQAGAGSIVNITSMCGDIVVQPQPQISYNAAKAGANLLTKSLAVEWARAGVRVKAVAPGYTATELTLRGRSNPEWFSRWMAATPMGRLGEPREIANAVLFLASPASSFITGTVLTVDGGYTAL